MTRLEALKAALEALKTADAAWDAGWGNLPLKLAYDEAYLIFHDLLTDDTVAALIAVAEAVDENRGQREYERILAPLLEEVPDDRA